MQRNSQLYLTEVLKMYTDTLVIPKNNTAKHIRQLPLPVKGKSYMLEEIYLLDIRDTPSLCFIHNGISGCIQDSHLSHDQLLAVPGMKESRWVYERETHEWIPIFYFDIKAIQLPITALIDLELEIDIYRLNKGPSWWATPKGYPRDQRL